MTQSHLQRIQDYLRKMLDKSGAHTIFLIDRSGQMVSHIGRKSIKDLVDMAALIAASFGSIKAIARMLDEDDFSLLFHKGDEENIHYSRLGEDFLLVTLFDGDASLGKIRLHVERSVALSGSAAA